MVEAGLRAFGRLDALVNNAALYGALHGGRFDAIDEAEWDDAMTVNVKGIWNCCKAAVPAMRQSISKGAGGGSIVNIASLAATYGMPYGLHYTTSKAAVIGLTRGLARELGRDRIRVNALAPGYIDTEMNHDFWATPAGEKLAKRIPQRRVGAESDLDGAIMLLASSASRYMTGSVITVDGGFLLT
jgi:3-oxoacyl-[acyl-carrier protein] reductase